MSHKGRPSLLGSLLWIGIGILLLLWNFGVGPDFWSMIGRYWPVLLILLGLGKVLEFYLKKEAISIRFGEIFGIILLVLAGTVINAISRSNFVQFIRDWPIHLGETSVKPGQWIGESHSYTEEATYPIDPSMPVRIENSYGSISISPGSDREIQVRLRKNIFANESRARNIAEEIHVISEVERKRKPAKTDGPEYFTVRTNRDDFTSKNYTFNTDMEILVPKNSHLQVDNAFGEIHIAGITGDLDINAAHRALEVRDCTGEFTITTRYADSRLTNLTGNVTVNGRGRIRVDTVKGNVRVTNEYEPTEILNVDGEVSVSNTDGNIRIEGISQPVVIEARGSQVRVGDVKGSLKVTASHKNVDIYNVDSDVTVESRYCTLALKDVKGNTEIRSNSDRVSADEIQGSLKLKARSSNIRLNGIHGPLEVQNSLKDIIVNDLSESCTISNEYADISVSALHLEKGNLDIKNKNGGIDLFLPEEESFSIDATARNGRIDADYEGLESVRKDRTAVLRSQVKTGGPRITLDTQYGNIHISRKSVRRVETFSKKVKIRKLDNLDFMFDFN